MALAKFDLLILEDTPYSEDKYMFIADHYKNMGVYKTKKRALEVLDEIQKAILFSGASYEEVKNLKEGITGFISTNTKSYVTIYEMPEE